MENKINTILVSPHSDDIAYSIGGSLLQDFLFRPILMVTVFPKSNYSPCIRKGNSETISNMRHLEDVEFTNKLNIEFKSFHFSEPSLRGYSDRDIFSNNNPNSDPIYMEVYYCLSELIKSYKCKLIVSPIGLGKHIDHVIVSDICYKISKENNIKIIFYEELPYAFRSTMNQIKVRAQVINPNLRPYKIDITSVYNNKIKNIKLYKTQTFVGIQTKIKLHALRLGIENKSLIELIWPFNLNKYLLCLLINKCRHVNLFERIWITQVDWKMYTERVEEDTH